jgi:hypothetical protein
MTNGDAQDEGQAELRTAQRAAGELFGARRHHVVKLWRDVPGFAGVAIAEVVDHDIDDELVNRLQALHGTPLSNS